MRTVIRATSTLALAFVCSCMFGCPDALPDGTTDMTTPAPCTNDADCGDNGACVFPNGEDQTGICDVDETEVSTGVPAHCSSAQDCPEGIACVFANETDEQGFCDVQEMIAP